VSACVDILTSTGRYAEAVLLSKTYQPSLTAGLVQRWKAELVKNGHERFAKSIASPDGNLDLFPGWTDDLEKEHASQNGSLAEGKKFIKFHLIVVEEKIGGMSLIDVQDGVSGIGEGINGTGNLKI